MGFSATLIERLNNADVAFKENENIASRSSFKIGGVAKIAIFPDTAEKLICALNALDDEGIKVEIIGNASNILFAFDSFDGAIVFTGGISGVLFDGNFVIAACGTSLTYLAELAAKNSLSGLEFAYGIPGLVGGSVYMNAGAYGGAMSDVVQSTLAYDRENKRLIEIKTHGFAYRKSVYMGNKSLVCLEARFALNAGDESEIRAKMQENMRSRRENQPLEYPSAGSYFKRPEGHFAGKLIEDCGLKGMSVGGAEVSVKHAGFIINKGNASAADVLALEKKIKERVMSRFGVELEREVRLVR